MGGFSIWHWIFLLAIILIPASIAALIAVVLMNRKKPK